MTYGSLTTFDEGATVRFERLIDAAIDAVWKALTDSSDLAQWLAPAAIEPGEGGTVVIDFGEEGRVTGTVVTAVAPTTLEYTWTFPGEGESVVRFELFPEGNGTRLVLEHRLLPHGQAPGYGAGWHAHLDMLEAVVTGSDPVAWDERFNEVLSSYQAG